MKITFIKLTIFLQPVIIFRHHFWWAVPFCIVLFFYLFNIFYHPITSNVFQNQLGAVHKCQHFHECKPYTFGVGEGLKINIFSLNFFLGWILLFSCGFLALKKYWCVLFFGRGGVSESVWFVYNHENVDIYGQPLILIIHILLGKKTLLWTKKIDKCLLYTVLFSPRFFWAKKKQLFMCK